MTDKSMLFIIYRKHGYVGHKPAPSAVARNIPKNTQLSDISLSSAALAPEDSGSRLQKSHS